MLGGTEERASVPSISVSRLSWLTSLPISDLLQFSGARGRPGGSTAATRRGAGGGDGSSHSHTAGLDHPQRPGQGQRAGDPAWHPNPKRVDAHNGSIDLTLRHNTGIVFGMENALSTKLYTPSIRDKMALTRTYIRTQTRTHEQAAAVFVSAESDTKHVYMCIVGCELAREVEVHVGRDDLVASFPFM